MSPISLWLADYQLLAAALLLGVMLAVAALRQPAQRLAVAKSTLAALAALAILCALPGWSLVHLLSDDATIAEPAASRAAPSSAFSATPSTTEPAPDLFHTQPPESPAGAVSHVAPRHDQAEQAQPIDWSAWLVAAYLAGSAAVTLWLIAGALLARRVRRQATPAPPELQALLQQLCGEEKSLPELLLSPDVTAPVALGIWKPAILLPPPSKGGARGGIPDAANSNDSATLSATSVNQSSRSDVAAPSKGWEQPSTVAGGDRAQGGSPREAMRGGIPDAANLIAPSSAAAPFPAGEGLATSRTEASSSPIQHSAFSLQHSQLLPILAHELAHLQHRDLHALAATRLLLILLWPQPLYWLLRRTIRLDQETLADAAAADRAGRLDYAQQLLAWASTAGARRPPRLAGAVGLWEGPSQLKRRISVLLNEKFQVMRTCSKRWRWLSVSCIAAVVAMLSLVTLQPVTDAAEDAAATSTATSPEVVMARKNELLRGIVREKNSVRGYCVDEHGKPLAGAKISLFTYQSGGPQVFREVLSDQRGYFAIDAAIDVEQAKFDGIPVDKPFDSANGWTPITINAHTPGRAVSYDHIPTVLLVQDGDLRIFELRPGKSLNGKVTDAAGRAVAGVQVTAGGYVLSSATTDANGDYEIRDLYPMDGAPGHQLTPVEFRHPDFALQNAGPATVPGKLDVTLHPGGTIEGRVEMQDGASNQPAANVDVMIARFKPLTPEENPSSRVPGTQYSRIIDREWVRTNDAGEYRIQSLAPADYGVTVIQNDQNELVTNGVAPIAVKPKETAAAPPIILTPGARIRVKLIDAETKRPVQFDKLVRGGANPILSSPTIPSMQLRREFKPYGDFGEVRVAPGTYSLFVTNRSKRLDSVNGRLPSGNYPAYHEFQVEEGKDLEFVVPMRRTSGESVEPDRPAAPPGIIIEGNNSVPGASASPPLAPFVTKGVQLPPAQPTASVRAVPSPAAGLTPLDAYLNFITDSPWRLVPQPAPLESKASSTLGRSVK